MNTHCARMCGCEHTRHALPASFGTRTDSLAVAGWPHLTALRLLCLEHAVLLSKTQHPAQRPPNSNRPRSFLALDCALAESCTSSITAVCIQPAGDTTQALSTQSLAWAMRGLKAPAQGARSCRHEVAGPAAASLPRSVQRVPVHQPSQPSVQPTTRVSRTRCQATTTQRAAPPANQVWLASVLQMHAQSHSHTYMHWVQVSVVR